VSPPGALVVMTAEQVEALVTKAVAAALKDRPVADDYIDKHSAHTVGLSASGFVAHCRAEHFPVETRGRRYVAKRSDVLAHLAAPTKPKTKTKAEAPVVEPAAANPIDAALANGRLTLVKRS
jgi:hypothetical protein